MPTEENGSITIVLSWQFPEEDAQNYDDTLPKMEKKLKPSQEEFFILSNAFLE